MTTISFGTEDFSESRVLLDALFQEVRKEEGSLAGGEKLGVGGIALQSLRETSITFGDPHDNLTRLTPKLFEAAGAELDEFRKRQLRDQFDFYYLTLAVSMKPGRGAQFTRLECQFDFEPRNGGNPIVQTIFPSSEWREVLNWGGELKLGLDASLDWSAGIDMTKLPPGLLDKLPGKIKASISNPNQLKSFIAIPEFKYTLGRSEVTATGEGNNFAFWRIDKPELVEAQTVKLGVVFKVPKGTKQVTLTAKAAAEPDIPWLVANVRDVFEDLSQKLQNLLRRKDDERKSSERLPIGDHERWTLQLIRE